jgi:protein unc-45
VSSLVERCVAGDEVAAKELVKAAGTKEGAGKLAREGGLERLLARDGKVEKNTLGGILLKITGVESSSVGEDLMTFIVQHPETRDSFLDCGSRGVEAYTNILIKTWKDPTARRNLLRQVLSDFTQRLNRPSDETTPVALLNSLIRIFQIDQTPFRPSNGSLPFTIFLNLLSSSTPKPIRSRVILLLSSILSPEKGDSVLLSTLQSQLSDFITSKFANPSPEMYVTVFSVLTSVFTIRSDCAAPSFLQEGFLEESFAGVLQLHGRGPIIALLELFSAAAVDKTCRTAILNLPPEVLQDYSQIEDPEINALAGSVIAKLGRSTPGTSQVDLVRIFNDALKSQNESALVSSVEGLAFSSTTSAVKDELSKNEEFLRSALGILKSGTGQHALVYGCLSILVNLTSYKPPLTEEEQRINELRKLAKEENTITTAELDQDEYVTKRCKAVLQAGLLPAFGVLAGHASPGSLAAMARILLSLTTVPAHRGLLAQQGAVKLLLTLLDKTPDEHSSEPLSHALAKLLISVNPSLIFSSRTPLAGAIPPLTVLLTDTTAQHNNLPRFECLLALTNLASVNDPTRLAIYSSCSSTIATCLLDPSALIIRATTELICNLVVATPVAQTFFPPTGTNKLHVLLAMTDVDDALTRRAATGALAMLTDFPEICASLVDNVERGVERLVRTVGDEDLQVGFRGVVALGNLWREGGAAGREKVVKVEGEGKVREFLARNGDEGIGKAAEEVLELLGKG